MDQLSGEARRELAANRFELGLIEFGKGVERVRVDIEHGEQFARPSHDRYDDLRASAARTSDVIRELRYIGDALGAFAARCSAAYAARKWDAQATVRALIRTNHQEIRAAHAIKPSPVEVVEGMVQLARDRRLCGDEVVFVGEECAEARAHSAIHFTLRGFIHEFSHSAERGAWLRHARK